jgi:iron complex outermembrane recepter protein
MRSVTVSILLLATAIPTLAMADTAPAAPAPGTSDDTPFSLGQIIVSSRSITPLTVGSSTLSANAIAAFDRVTLDDAVNMIPGVYSGMTGGTRNEGLIYVRGFNRFEVPLLIDGIRVYLPADNRLDFSRFLTSDIAEVQVAKGYVSVLDGPDGMGGAINLVTRKPTRELEAELDGTLDLGRSVEYGGYNLSGRIGTKHDTWYLAVSGARNYVDHWDLAGGFVPTASQGAGQRNFSQNEDWRINVKAGFTPNATDEYSINYTRQEGSKLAPLSTVDAVSAQKYWTWPAWNMDSIYALTNTQISDSATLKARAYRNSFYNLLRSFDSVSETTQSKGYAFNSPYWDKAWGGSLELALKPAAGDRLTLSAQYRLDQHQEQETAFPGAKLQPMLTDKENTISLAAENELTLAPGWTLLAGAGYDWRNMLDAVAYGAPLGTNPNTNASVVYNWPRNNVGAWAAQAQLTWQADPNTSIHASASSRVRFPTLFELYSQKFGTSIPNPYLEPERATNFELGASRRQGAVSFDAAGFYSYLNHVIVSQSVIGYSCTASTTPGPCASSAMTQSINAANGMYYGAELSIQAQLGRTLSLGGNYTWVHQIVHYGASKVGGVYSAAAPDPTNVPNSKAFVYADWAPTARLHLRPAADIESNRWTVTDVAPIYYFRTGSHVNAQFSADYEVTPNAHATIGVRNLFDQNYQLVSGYPSEGRSYYASLRLTY